MTGMIYLVSIGFILQKFALPGIRGGKKKKKKENKRKKEGVGGGI